MRCCSAVQAVRVPSSSDPGALFYDIYSLEEILVMSEGPLALAGRNHEGDVWKRTTPLTLAGCFHPPLIAHYQGGDEIRKGGDCFH